MKSYIVISTSSGTLALMPPPEMEEPNPLHHINRVYQRKFDEYHEHLASLETIDIAPEYQDHWKKGDEVKEGEFYEMIICPLCGGDGKETCSNPDHGFIEVLAFHEVGRLGCPVCGHDPKHKVKNGGSCEVCNGTGKINSGEFQQFCNDYKYDNEPLAVAIPKAKEQEKESELWEQKLYNQLKHIYDQYSDEWTFYNEKQTADLLYEYQTRNIP